MFRSVTLAVLAAMVALAAAQANPCCVPTQWEGQRGGLGAEVFTVQPELVGIGEKVFYDYKNNRLRLDINISSLSGREDREASEIYRFDLGYRYIIERGACRAEKINHTMPAFCVPSYAQKRGEATLGLSLNTEAWSWKNGDTAYELIVAQGSCAPVVQAAANVERIAERAIADLWLNITAGISDPSVFNPPGDCRTVETSSVEHFDYHRYVLADLKRRL